MANVFSVKIARSAGKFRRDEQGGMTALALFGIVVCCMFAGLAIDVTNLHRHKQFLTVAADAAAQAGVIALSKKMTETQIQSIALTAAETNAPEDLVGKTTVGAADVKLVHFNAKTRTLEAGTPNAVQVTLHRDRDVQNPVATGLLRFAGFNAFEVSVTSVAYFGKPGSCTSTDGIYAKGTVTLTSGNTIGGSYCVHSQTAVWMPQENFFEKGAGLSMPNLEACGTKCVDSANPGVEDAKFEMNLELPRMADHIAMVKTAMMAPTSALKTQFFADKKLATDLKPLVDAKIVNAGAAAKLVKGSVVSLTPVQYNDLMINTNGNLPTGLVYEVDCRDRCNGPTTTIAIGAGTDRKDATKSTSAPETVRQVVLITDCSFDVGSNARIDATLAISTRITSSSGLNASSGAIVGDPLKNCDVSRKVYIMTMSSVNVSADFTASNVALMVNGDIHVAASSSSSEVEHKGTSFHAEGEVQIPANHTFNGCLEDYSGLIPGVRTLRFVMPRA
jgi:Flp pilus assembly protein TadG